MGRLVWDRIEDRSYEIGADHAVLYVPDENNVFKGVVWNGLTKVTKESTRDTETTYFDGMKIHNYVKQTEFKGSLDAITYPDEFEQLEGSYQMKCGVFVGEQPPGIFGLSYRSKVGNVSGSDVGYKLHVLYNLLATPSSKEYETMGDSPKLMEFSWDLESMPEPVLGFRPTAEITIDSRKADPLLLIQLEEILYGNDIDDAYLPSMDDLVALIDGWFRLLVTVDNNGKFTVEEKFDGTHIVDHGDGTWTLVDADAIFVDADRYALSTRFCLPPTTPAVIEITDPENGTWTAATDYDSLIIVDEDENSPTYGMFTIYNATVVTQNAELYRITDTLPD
jgi:hypothetical protein